MYYPSSENKGADQLCGYREADLRLCFRICRLLVFPRGGSFLNLQYYACHHFRSFSLLCKDVGSKNHLLKVNSLAEDIIPGESYFKVSIFLDFEIIFFYLNMLSYQTWRNGILQYLEMCHKRREII